SARGIRTDTRRPRPWGSFARTRFQRSVPIGTARSTFWPRPAALRSTTVTDSLGSMMRWRRAGILAAVAALIMGLAVTSLAGKKKHKSKVRWWSSTATLTHPSPTQFSGVVGSKLAACRKARVVTLYYTDPTNGQTQPLSVQRTDGQGQYQVNLAAPAYP